MAWGKGSSHSKNRSKTLRGWGFTFFGETSTIERTEGNSTENMEELPENESASRASFPLFRANVGDRVRIVGIIDKGGTSHLLSLGLTPGNELTIISRAPSGSIVVALQDNRIGLGAGTAQTILVTDVINSVSTSNQAKPMDREINTYLRNLPVGCRGRIVGYEQVTGGYKGRLLAMGLTPGTEFTVIRHTPLGDSIEIEVQGSVLSLRKHEADVLCIEELNDGQ
jgi:ferrous iron transport protein A